MSIDSDNVNNFRCLLPPFFEEEVMRWLKDDCPSTDIGGFVVGEKEEEAHLLCKSPGVLAGTPFAQVVFDALQLSVEWRIQEGSYIDLAGKASVIVAIVRGKCRNILLAERTALNTLSRASGVASRAARSLRVAKEANWKGWLAGTRKTTPGFKHVEKYALVVGGCATHRQDLSQMVMLKDNHIWSSGSITKAVNKARQAAGFSMKIEVECQSVAEALEAVEAGAEIVMLDNFNSVSIHAAAEDIKRVFPTVLIEASGGITEATLSQFMGPHIDIISQGSLTQGYSCVDFSLKVRPKNAPQSPTVASASIKT